LRFLCGCEGQLILWPCNQSASGSYHGCIPSQGFVMACERPDRAVVREPFDGGMVVFKPAVFLRRLRGDHSDAASATTIRYLLQATLVLRLAASSSCVIAVLLGCSTALVHVDSVSS